MRIGNSNFSRLTQIISEPDQQARIALFFKSLIGDINWCAFFEELGSQELSKRTLNSWMGVRVFQDSIALSTGIGKDVEKLSDEVMGTCAPASEQTEYKSYQSMTIQQRLSKQDVTLKVRDKFVKSKLSTIISRDRSIKFSTELFVKFYMSEFFKNSTKISTLDLTNFLKELMVFFQTYGEVKNPRLTVPQDLQDNFEEMHTVFNNVYEKHTKRDEVELVITQITSGIKEELEAHVPFYKVAQFLIWANTKACTEAFDKSAAHLWKSQPAAGIKFLRKKLEVLPLPVDEKFDGKTTLATFADVASFFKQKSQTSAMLRSKAVQTFYNEGHTASTKVIETEGKALNIQITTPKLP